MTNMLTGLNDKPEVTVSPRGHLLVDDELHIRVQGLDSGQEVTIHTGINVSGKTMESCCQFRADESGVVDLYNHPSLAGSYSGVSPMGILWSMVPTPDMPKGFRLVIRDVSKPVKAHVSVYPGNHTADDIRTKQTTAMVTQVIERWYKGQGVTSVKVTHGRLRGTLFLPPGPGPHPGVIDLFGSAGGLLEFRSALMASRGIASLALAYFMYEDLPGSLLELDLDYFLEAVHWLRSYPKVYGDGVGVVGVSKGGDIAYLMAANCPQVRAVVNINGCTFNSSFLMRYSRGDIPGIMLDLDKVIKTGDVWSTDAAFDNMYDEKALIPVWRHNPSVLNIVSEDDKSMPNDCVYMTRKQYPRHSVHRFTILSYPDAGHLVEPPYNPSVRMSYHKSLGIYALWGGQSRPHADAQEDAWKKMLKFLHMHLPTSNSGHSKL